MRVIFYDENGTNIYDHEGVWSFSWVLDGRAVQDVLVYPNPDEGLSTLPDTRRIGTTLRFYDKTLDAWRVVWLGAVTGNLGVMTARSAVKRYGSKNLRLTDRSQDGSSPTSALTASTGGKWCQTIKGEVREWRRKCSRPGGDADQGINLARGSKGPLTRKS